VHQVFSLSRIEWWPYRVDPQLSLEWKRSIIFIYGVYIYMYIDVFQFIYDLVFSFALMLFKNWMHSFEVSLGYESVDRSTFSMKRGSASCWKCSSINVFITLHWKCTSVNTFIPQWKFKRMHSILIIIFKSHQNLI
jgi:hypothetical protein